VVRHDPARLGDALRAVLHDYALQEQLSVSRAIFREYDIRGIVGSEMTVSGRLNRWAGALALHATAHRTTTDHRRRDVRPSSARLDEP